MEKNNSLPPVVWLRVTDFMAGWLQHELGGTAKIRDQRIVCLQHLPGAKEVFRMETEKDATNKGPVGNTMSDKRKNIVLSGLDIDEAVMERDYGMTRETLGLFVPIECPKNCMTGSGVLRPWTLDVCLGRKQANAMLDLIRREFWGAVERFNRGYAEKAGGRKYPAVEMIEAFCRETGTCDVHVAAMRREWQRRVKRAGSRQ